MMKTQLQGIIIYMDDSQAIKGQNVHKVWGAYLQTHHLQSISK